MTQPPRWQVQWAVRSFEQLTTHDLYALLALRSQVFVVEQNCVFQDIDGHDELALHVLGFSSPAGAPTQLVAYARCYAPGVKMVEANIGRVVTAEAARGAGLGHELVTQALALVLKLWGQVPVRIGAQKHLSAFYQQHGFLPTGAPYMEDGIEHIEMLRPATGLTP